MRVLRFLLIPLYAAFLILVGWYTLGTASLIPGIVETYPPEARYASYVMGLLIVLITIVMLPVMFVWFCRRTIRWDW